MTISRNRKQTGRSYSLRGEDGIYRMVTPVLVDPSTDTTDDALSDYDQMDGDYEEVLSPVDDEEAVLASLNPPAPPDRPTGYGVRDPRSRHRNQSGDAAAVDSTPADDAVTPSTSGAKRRRGRPEEIAGKASPGEDAADA